MMMQYQKTKRSQKPHNKKVQRYLRFGMTINYKRKIYISLEKRQNIMDSLR